MLSSLLLATYPHHLDRAGFHADLTASVRRTHLLLLLSVVLLVDCLRPLLRLAAAAAQNEQEEEPPASAHKDCDGGCQRQTEETARCAVAVASTAASRVRKVTGVWALAQELSRARVCS